MADKLILTVDPGDSTGWALWKNSIHPITGQFNLDRDRISGLEKQLIYMWEQFDNLLSKQNPTYCLIEGVEVWEGSLKSHTASIIRKNQTVPSLFKLSMLVGGYCNICDNHRIEFGIITFRQWGGQLSPEAVKAQVKRLTGNTYTSQHIYDAVAMGLNYLGKL